MADDVNIRVRIQDARRAASDAGKVEKGIKGIRQETDRADRSARRAATGLSRFSQWSKRGIKGAVGLAAGYASVAAARNAVNTTEDLAKSTLTLNKSFGLSVGLASQWAAIGKVRGAEGKALTMGFKAFATAVRNARIQGGGALKPFEQLGVTQDQLVKKGDNLKDVLDLVSDGLGGMKAGPEKAAISARLFGRTWTAIAPVIREGSDEMREQLKLADKYGATFGGKSLEDLEEMIKAQREAKLATLGLKVSFGQLVAPALTRGLQRFSTFWADIRQDAGRSADFGDVMALGIRRAVPEIANEAGRVGPKAAGAFLQGWLHADAWGKLAVFGFLAAKMGAYKPVGRYAAKKFATSFAPVAATTIAAETTATSGAGSILGRMRAGGKLGRIGRIGGRALGAGIAAGVLLAAPEIVRSIESALGITPGKGALGQYSGKAGWGELGRDLLDYLPGEDSEDRRARERRNAPPPPATPMTPGQRRRNRGGDHKRAGAARVVVPVTVTADGRPIARATAYGARVLALST